MKSLKEISLSVSEENTVIPNYTTIDVYTIEGIFIGNFFNLYRALEFLNIDKVNIGNVVNALDSPNAHYGYIWKSNKKNIDILEGEFWKALVGYKGYYYISNKGRLARVYVKGNSGRNPILSTSYNKNGYEVVSLKKDKITKSYLVHRLVAITFISNPDNLLEINHKDENKKNNSVENLEWCNRKYNINYNNLHAKNTIIIANKNKNNPKTSKIVQQYSIDGHLLHEYPSAREAARALGYIQSEISRACLGFRKTSTGTYNIYKYKNYIWKYKENL